MRTDLGRGESVLVRARSIDRYRDIAIASVRRNMMSSRPTERRLGAVAAALHVRSTRRSLLVREEAPLSCERTSEAGGDCGMDGARWEPAALRQFGAALLQAAGMAPHQATAVAEVAVEGDLLNHNTHGIRLLPTVLCVVGNSM